MEQQNFILLEQHRGAECVPCSYEKFVEVVSSNEVKQKIQAYRTGLEQAANLEAAGELELAKTTKANAYINKQTLPGFLFQAYDMDENVYENKKKGTKKVGKFRKQGCAHCNGIAMIDIDHVEDPRAMFKDIFEKHRALFDNGTIELVFITPSGHGLKIVFKCDPEKGNLMENQQWMGNLLGVEIDEKCKDASRLSFAPMYDEVLFDDNGLWVYYNEDYDKKFTPLYNESQQNPSLFPNGQAPKASGKSQSGQKKNSKTATSEGGSSAASGAEGAQEQRDYSEYRYRGIAIPDLIDSWLEGKKPEKGVRHNTLLALVKELKYVCERNDNIVRYFVDQLDWVQELRAEGDKVDDTISDGLGYKMGTNIPAKMNSCITELLPAATENEHDDPQLKPFEEWGKEFEKMFDDYPCMREVCHGLEPSAYPAAIFCAAAFFGTLMTRCTYHFYDKPERERRLNYGIIIIGDPGSGKSAIGPLFDAICSPIIANDEIGNKMINEWKDRTKDNQNKSDKKKVDMPYPDVQIRINGTRTSNGEFIRNMNKCMDDKAGRLMHLHLLTFDSELDSVTSASKGGQWIDKSVMELKAFHNEQDNQQYMNKDSYSGPFNVYWNYVYTGTPISLQRKVNERNFGTGLFARLAVLPICSHYFKMMEFATQSKKNVEVEETLKSWAYKLDATYGELPFWPLVKSTWQWCARYMSLSDMDGDKPEALLIRRVPYYGINVSAPYIVMRHWDEWCAKKSFTVDKKDIVLCQLIMDIQHYSQKMYFGKFAEMYFQDRVKDQASRTVRTNSKTDKWFAVLEKEFTIDDIIRISQSNKHAAVTLAWRWEKRGWIQRLGKKGDSRFKKTA